ncbi:DDX58 [Mytilus coruscus]|uniref:DDX58 n=1 Tax=Mytilus coruscus TaxID=42192 RepID=A0A6J8CEX3_MYTCO|nr:DDX58 [Mytilus coruscus]
MCTREGAVEQAWCTCMAGLGLSCSHVGALLWKIAYAVRNSMTGKNWLSGSPDGIFDGRTLLEIKCPVPSTSWSTLDQLFESGKYDVGKDENGDLVVKEKGSRGIYLQVQLTMYCMGLKQCKLLVWLGVDEHRYIDILYDETVCDAVNDGMTSHIKTFMKGWNPTYNNPTVLKHAGSEEGFITHGYQPSWQCLKLKEYKSKPDIKYIENCSTKTRRLLMKRTIGDQSRKPVPEIPEEMQWMRKINIWKAEEDDNDYFIHKIKNSSLMFLTPQSLSNHLTEKAKKPISIREFTLIVLDECHHTYDNSNYNELMAYYRKAKYGEKLSSLPQILGLTASPGTKKAKDLNSAKHHLRTVMTNLAVSKLSIVKRNEEELLQYTTIPEKVSSFLIDHMNDCRDLYDALNNPPKQRTEIRYIQWIAETKDKVEHVLHKDPKIPRLLHACFRHLELYTECLEVNSLLEVDQVCNVITQGYADESAASQNAKTDEETEIVNKLKEVFVDIREIGRKIEKNPDVKAVIELLDREYQKCKEDSRFLIFVKTRATARALTDVLPDYLRSTYLTGSHKCIAEDGLPPDEQIAVLENFRNGDHLCAVATSVASEGLDIPLCNLMIRYRFRANEISSLQMRGEYEYCTL